MSYMRPVATDGVAWSVCWSSFAGLDRRSREPLDGRVHIGATWRVRCIDLCGGSGAACRYYYCFSLSSVAVGDKVPADIRVLRIYSTTLRVDQAILTGN